MKNTVKNDRTFGIEGSFGAESIKLISYGQKNRGLKKPL